MKTIDSNGLLFAVASAWLLTASTVCLAAPHANNNAQKQAQAQAHARQQQAQQQQKADAQRREQQQRQAQQEKQHQQQVAAEHREQQQKAAEHREQQQQKTASEHREQQQKAASEHREQEQKAAAEHREQEKTAFAHREQEQRQHEDSKHGQSFQFEHPGRAEVLGRDAHLNKVLGEDKGDLNGHYAQLESEDRSIRRQEQSDAARNGGRLTGQEDRQLNHEENNLSGQISRDNYGAGNAQFQSKHPARSEVLGRDANLNKVLGEDKGDLNGRYGQLESEDKSIRRQEQLDAARNGGRLTGQEYKQLNGEENNLGRQISRDNYGAGDAQFQAAHPGRSEVLGRDANLNKVLGEDKGDLSGHYGQLESEDNSIRRQEQVDAARNGGRLTGQEYRQLNNEENNLGRQISRDNYGAGDAQFRANHPARSEVLSRDANLNKVLGQDKGDLSGHYGQLESEDNSIRRQEQIDAARNGGRLTGQEYKQLNGEENKLGRQISRDNYGAGDAQFQAAHPGRSEVLGRDANLNNQINQDKGQLSGQYGQLKREDRSIQLQEQRDAMRNGGYLTGQQSQQLNREEAALQNQIRQDHN